MLVVTQKMLFLFFFIDLIRLPSSSAFLASIASLTRHCSEHVFRKWLGFKELSSSYIWFVFEDELKTSYVTKVACFSFFLPALRNPTGPPCEAAQLVFCGRCLFSYHSDLSQDYQLDELCLQLDEQSHYGLLVKDYRLVCWSSGASGFIFHVDKNLLLFVQ